MKSVQCRSPRLVVCLETMLKAVIDVILNERALGIGNGLFHRIQLLGDVGAAGMRLDHPDDMRQMSGRALEALGNRRMRCVQMRLCATQL